MINQRSFKRIVIKLFLKLKKFLFHPAAIQVSLVVGKKY